MRDWIVSYINLLSNHNTILPTGANYAIVSYINLLSNHNNRDLH